jgi:hypothetical protein
MFRSRLLRLILLDHDKPVRSLGQRVELNVWFVMDSADRRLEHLGTVIETGKP